MGQQSNKKFHWNHDKQKEEVKKGFKKVNEFTPTFSHKTFKRQLNLIYVLNKYCIYSGKIISAGDYTFDPMQASKSLSVVYRPETK